jgi:hypothetical protein
MGRQLRRARFPLFSAPSSMCRHAPSLLKLSAHRLDSKKKNPRHARMNARETRALVIRP